ncbi:hypothetical protein DRJ19_04605 [Candidatus Woesearchaeota archaeon]|nr:MAG: hypothetical protein DRJ19_04605 [Candidatus Woesearchaeota archaeon]
MARTYVFVVTNQWGPEGPYKFLITANNIREALKELGKRVKTKFGAWASFTPSDVEYLGREGAIRRYEVGDLLIELIHTYQGRPRQRKKGRKRK